MVADAERGGVMSDIERGAERWAERGGVTTDNERDTGDSVLVVLWIMGCPLCKDDVLDRVVLEDP